MRPAFYALLVLPLLTSCEILPDLTPDEAARLEVLENQADQDQADAEHHRAQYEQAAAELKAAIRERDAARVEEAQAVLLATSSAHDVAVARYQAAVAEADDIEQTGIERRFGWVAPMLNLLPPGPWQSIPQLLGLGQLAVLAGSRRARHRLAEGIKEGARGNLMGLAAGVLKSMGALHSSAQSAEAHAKARADELEAEATQARETGAA